ncbi:amidohydrolase [Seminavis robusta]|uniref:Amidohydrolase n=2 Tax=Seminavis robusta TaxID=568900 RepID=A0A9N8ED19_9STRA|nr:amidohydrolase [Seminavis robusta]|eukprot:Sro944_g223010.1 amidohydrolase (646) ;mRNA; f:36362-38299
MMNMFVARALAAVLLLAAGVSAQEILYNAIVYTVNPSQPSAEAIAIDADGIIVGVGTYDDLTSEFPDYTLTDLEGQLVLPGFQDAHLHAVEAGINAQLCFVEADALIEDIPYYFDEPDCTDYGEFGGEGWVMGAGVDLEAIVQELETNLTARYPITVLDESWPDQPVVILDQFGHGCLANTAALQAVGYFNSPDPPGGHILKDSDGFHTGIVTENAQQKLREAAFPNTEANQQVAYESLLDALDELRSNGITTVSDAGGFYHQAQIESWERAEEEGVLTVRASNALYVYPDSNTVDQIRVMISKFSNDPNKLVRFNQAKIYVDGILSLSTGKLYEPYTYDPFDFYRNEENWSGFEYFGSNETLNFVAKSLVDNSDFQLHFHTTGDAGAGLALSAIEFVQGGAKTTGPPHRITHCYLVDEKDRRRFAELGVVADFQLAPSSLTPEYRTKMEGFLGRTRADTLLPALELYEANATITLSSDWDADTLSPLEKIQTVLTRPDGRSFPDVATVIPMLTINPAYLLQHDDTTGSIEVGKFADLAVIDQDIFNMPVDEISTANVTRTYLQGDLIFGPGADVSRVDGSIEISETDPTGAGSEENGATDPKDVEIDTGGNVAVSVEGQSSSPAVFSSLLAACLCFSVSLLSFL